MNMWEDIIIDWNVPQDADRNDPLYVSSIDSRSDSLPKASE